MPPVGSASGGSGDPWAVAGADPWAAALQGGGGAAGGGVSSEDPWASGPDPWRGALQEAAASSAPAPKRAASSSEPPPAHAEGGGGGGDPWALGADPWSGGVPTPSAAGLGRGRGRGIGSRGSAPAPSDWAALSAELAAHPHAAAYAAAVGASLQGAGAGGTCGGSGNGGRGSGSGGGSRGKRTQPRPVAARPERKTRSRNKGRKPQTFLFSELLTGAPDLEAQGSSVALLGAAGSARAEVLLAVSSAHLDLAFAPHEFLKGPLRSTANFQRKAGSYTRLALVWLVAAVAIGISTPLTYMHYIWWLQGEHPTQSIMEMVLRSPWALLVTPGFLAACCGLWFAWNACLAVLQLACGLSGSRADCARQWLCWPVYILFFAWVRRRIPRLLLNDFQLFLCLPNHAFRIAVCLSYAAMVVQLLLAAISRGDALTGTFVAYALGEVYCFALDWLLAPPADVAALVESELRTRGTGGLWLKLYRHSARTLELGSREALVVARAASQGCRSLRHVTSLVVTDLGLDIDGRDVAAADEYGAPEVEDEDDDVSEAGFFDACCCRTDEPSSDSESAAE